MKTLKSRFIYFFLFLDLLAFEAQGQTSQNTTLIGRWAEGPCFATAAVGNIVYFGNGGYLEIVDFTDPINPVELGKILTPSVVQDIAINGSYAYIADKFAGLRVIDISNPANLIEAGFLEIGYLAQAVAITGSYAYLIDLGNGLHVIDISDPTNPAEAGFWSSSDYCYNVAISGSYAYITNGEEGLRVIDVSDPRNPLEKGSLKIAGSFFNDVALNGNYAYVADWNSAMRVINVSDPTNPTEIAFFKTGIYSQAYITTNGDYAYLAQAGLRVIDISNPATPSQVGQIPGVGYGEGGVTVSGSYAYIANGGGGVRIINVSNPAVLLEVGFFITGNSVTDLVISNSYAFLPYGRRIQIIDVSNPANPVKAGYSGYFESFVTNMAVNSHYIYGMYAFTFLAIDISDPLNPVEIGSCPLTFTSGSITDLVVNGRYAYVLINNSSIPDRLQIVDIINPTNPSVIGDLQLPGLAGGMTVKGSYVYVCAGDAGLRIIDVSDPANPIEVSYFGTTTDARSVAVSNHYAYVTISWGLKIVDISNPANPIEAGFFSTSLPTDKIRVSNNYAYFTSQQHGIRIVDVSNPAHPFEIGYYDTGDYPDDVLIKNNHAYVADGADGLYIIRNDLAYRPVIAQISDIPNDQGKQVRVSWMKSSLDGAEPGGSNIVEYSLWRRIHESPRNRMTWVGELMKLSSDSLPPGEWDFIQTIPAIGNKTYNVVAPTLADSNHVHGMHWSTFAVIAHTANPLTYFVSEPDSGYSLDNLIPQAPTELLAIARDNVIDLSWKMVPDEDFNYYAIYRGIHGGFDPAVLQPYAVTVDTFFTDEILEPNTNYYYRISAFDFSGNEGKFSEEVSAIIVGINDDAPIPETYSLFQNFPNPYNPSTIIQYTLPNDQHVKLEVYDLLGKKIATLVDISQEAGTYSVTFDASQLPSGVYLYKLQAGSYNEIRKMILMR